MRTAKVIATFFGLGYMPFAPGTWGTAGAMLFSWLLSCIGTTVFTLGLLHISAIVAFYFSGVWACRKLSAEWGKDPSKCVADEAVGYWVSILFLPLEPEILLAAFVLFRFFDIAKPLGIRTLDRMETPHAVMLDDVLAGLYTLIVLQTAHVMHWI